MSVERLHNEKQLLLQLREGSALAFETIYRHYYSTLYLHAYSKTKNRELAKDIVQDLFASVWQQREQLDIQSNLSGYLYRSVRNRVIDIWAKEKSESKYLDSLLVMMTQQTEYADAPVREKILVEHVESLLGKLTPRVREVFELSRKDYLTYKQISEKLNISEQTVRGYAKEALKVLRYRLDSFLWVMLLVISKLF